MCVCVCYMRIVLLSYPLSASIAADGGTIDSVLTLFLSVPLKLPRSPLNPPSYEWTAQRGWGGIKGFLKHKIRSFG